MLHQKLLRAVFMPMETETRTREGECSYRTRSGVPIMRRLEIALYVRGS